MKFLNRKICQFKIYQLSLIVVFSAAASMACAQTPKPVASPAMQMHPKQALNNAEKQNTDNEMVQAVQNGQFKRVEALKKKGASIDAVDFGGQTGLMRLAENGEPGGIEEAMKAGANLNAENTDHETAIWYAVYAGHEDLALSLIKKGAKVDQVNTRTKECLLHRAVEGSMKRLIRELIHLTPKCLAQKNEDGFTPELLARDLEDPESISAFRPSSSSVGGTEGAKAKPKSKNKK